MSRLPVAFIIAAGLIVGALATPASGQFDPLHNNLKCYKIKGPSLAVSLQLDNQFSRERVFKLVPQFLCLPTARPRGPFQVLQDSGEAVYPDDGKPCPFGRLQQADRSFPAGPAGDRGHFARPVPR